MIKTLCCASLIAILFVLPASAFAQTGKVVNSSWFLRWDYNPYTLASEVMAANRAKYERMSVLSDMESPSLTVDPSGSVRFDLELDGHSVIHLRLE